MSKLYGSDRPKISIETFVCTTKELIDEKEKRYGGPNNCPMWDMSHYDREVISERDFHPTIALALKAVCRILCFDYAKKDWHFGMKDKCFHAQFYVDEMNNQIDEDEYAMWKRGEKRIWVCEVSVKVVVTEKRELTQFDLHPMLVYLQNADKVSEEFSQGFRNFWSRTQIQQLGASNPELFSLSPKVRHHRSKDFRALYDQFCKANFRAAHAAVEANPSLLTHASLDETFEFDGNENFDIVVFLDADCTSIVESLPALLSSQKVVLMGNPHYPAIEVLPNDAYNDVLPRHTAYFQESLQGHPDTRTLASRAVQRHEAGQLRQQQDFQPGNPSIPEARPRERQRRID